MGSKSFPELHHKGAHLDEVLHPSLRAVMLFGVPPQAVTNMKAVQDDAQCDLNAYE